MTTETQMVKPTKPDKLPIFIDGTKYEVHVEALTGAQIRALAIPPIGEDRDLWLERPGLDELIADNQVVELAHGMRFFSVPKVINPGQGPDAITVDS